MNSETFQLCKAILLWWIAVESQYPVEPDFVQMAARMLAEAIIQEEPEEEG